MTGKKGQIGFPGSKGEKGAQGPPGKVSTTPKGQTLKASDALLKMQRKKRWKKNGGKYNMAYKL